MKDYIPNLEHLYTDMLEHDRRGAAEVAYVLAVLSVKNGNLASASKFGKESVALFAHLNMQRLEDLASRHVILNGVALPDLINEQVVQARLARLGVSLD